MANLAGKCHIFLLYDCHLDLVVSMELKKEDMHLMHGEELYEVDCKWSSKSTSGGCKFIFYLSTQTWIFPFLFHFMMMELSFVGLVHMFNAINLGNIVDFLFNKDFVIVLLVSRTSFVRCI